MTALDGSLTLAPGIRSPRAGWRQAWAALVRARQAAVTRRHLAQMDDRLLADIGVSRGEALSEAGRAPWDTAPRR